ncbi:preprotein translocase subunit YajC [Marinilactibacillus sp. 15R]|uniref:Protein translocase subunit yajC n=1 Tax=Marinilactibacillus piezotolerans TaxID=258723 RepID=A0A1I4ABF5_9LACT|nr:MULTISPECIES: preprotein translocase subunit YajC [Marinilactibacillus]API89079.1 preprotein translocase subunit YajC [Marinilactibacillus sp. 15R]SFK53664.1 protein translocase subunit yajC [Marinilactibacillus piezotolerans]
MEAIFGTVLPFAFIIGIAYFLMVRPQQKRAKEAQNMLNSLQKGDSVVTIGGLHGVIDEVSADDKTVVLDCEGIYLTFERRAIARIVTKAETVSNNTTTTEELGTNTPDSSSEEE